MHRAAGSREQPVLIDYPDFDVQYYIHEYKGRSKLQRLMFIADRCPSAREKATTLLMQAVKEEVRGAIVDMRLYREIFTYGKKYLTETKEPDEKYIQLTTQKNQVRRTKLEDEIQKWRNLAQKDNSRIAHLRNAEFLCRLGDFQLAIHKLSDAKEFASTAEEMIECHLQIIFASVKEGSLAHVQNEASRLFLVNPDGYAWNTNSQVHACMGLYYLKNEKFNMARSHFLQAKRVGNFSEILSKRDIGVYAALCSLAVLERNQLKEQMLDNAEIMGYLQRAPVVKNLVIAMHESKYAVVMKTLASLMKDFRLDYYLYTVCDSLVDAVRGKALVQYFEPFSSMNLNRMARDFGVGLDHIEEELHKAILSGQVKGKIDLSNHTLIEYRDVTDRHAILKSIVQEGEAFCREATIVLCNLSLSAKKMDLNKSHLDNQGENGGMGEMNNNKYRFLGGFTRKGNRKAKFV